MIKEKIDQYRFFKKNKIWAERVLFKVPHFMVVGASIDFNIVVGLFAGLKFEKLSEKNLTSPKPVLE